MKRDGQAKARQPLGYCILGGGRCVEVHRGVQRREGKQNQAVEHPPSSEIRCKERECFNRFWGQPDVPVDFLPQRCPF